MKKWISRISLVFLGAVFGALAGGWFVYDFSRDAFKYTAEMLALNYSAWEAEVAFYHYKNSDSVIAKHSLEHYAEICNGFIKYNDRHNRQLTPAEADLAFTYIKLGFLAEKDGYSDVAQKYYEMALDSYTKYCKNNKIDRSYTVESLKELVAKLDGNENKPRDFASVLFIDK
jgi:hypothetical protein